MVSTASATQIPAGASSDAAYSGTGTASSLWSVSNGITNNLVTAAEIDQAATSSAGDTNNTLPATPAITAASGLNATNVAQIAADWANSANEQYYVGVIMGGSQYETQQQAEAEYQQLQAAVPTLKTDYTNEYPSVQELISLSSAGASSFPKGLYTLDGDIAISSAATVTATGSPTAISFTLGTNSTASGGFVLPSAFTFTFPANYSINLGLAGNELPASDEANPSADSSVSSLGTVTLNTPALQYLGLGSSTTVTGNIYAVQTGSSVADVSLELYIPAYKFYDVSSQIAGTNGGLSFPLSVSFGEFTIPGGGTDPLPLASMTLSFPAATSPVEATSCSSLGAVTATATDNLASLAPTFGDTADSGAIAATPSNTVVTNSCSTTKPGGGKTKTKVTAGKGKASGIKKGKPSFSFKLTDNKAFSSFTVTLPKGFSYKKFSTKDLKVSGAKIKKIKVKGNKLTVTLKKTTKSATVKLTKGITETKKAKKSKSVKLKLGVSGKTVTLKIKA